MVARCRAFFLGLSGCFILFFIYLFFFSGGGGLAWGWEGGSN